MIKAILYKEWIKTKWAWAAIVCSGVLLHIYLFVRLGRSFRLAGHEHIWDVIINRNQFLFYDLKYFPLAAGILLGLSQFVPEMAQKRLKLSLHLPLTEFRIISWMTGYGLVLLILFFSIHAAALLTGIHLRFAFDFLINAAVTVVPWYVAGIVAYLACVFTCTEPVWKRRIPNILLSAGILRVFFMSDFPASYLKMLPLLLVPVVLTVLFTYRSVYRFKIGEQD